MKKNVWNCHKSKTTKVNTSEKFKKHNMQQLYFETLALAWHCEDNA